MRHHRRNRLFARVGIYSNHVLGVPARLKLGPEWGIGHDRPEPVGLVAYDCCWVEAVIGNPEDCVRVRSVESPDGLLSKTRPDPGPQILPAPNQPKCLQRLACNHCGCHARCGPDMVEHAGCRRSLNRVADPEATFVCREDRSVEAGHGDGVFKVSSRGRDLEQLRTSRGIHVIDPEPATAIGSRRFCVRVVPITHHDRTLGNAARTRYRLGPP